MDTPPFKRNWPLITGVMLAPPVIINTAILMGLKEPGASDLILASLFLAPIFAAYNALEPSRRGIISCFLLTLLFMVAAVVLHLFCWAALCELDPQRFIFHGNTQT